jgi:molybdopterin converting factor small subunit
MSKIHIPTPLRQYVDKQSTVDVKASTVAEAMNALVAQHPELRRHLYAEDGKLRAFVNLYVNDEDIRYLQKEATPLQDGDNISIVPSIAGGMESAPLRCHHERSEGPWFLLAPAPTRVHL